MVAHLWLWVDLEQKSIVRKLIGCFFGFLEKHKMSQKPLKNSHANLCYRKSVIRTSGYNLILKYEIFCYGENLVNSENK